MSGLFGKWDAAIGFFRQSGSANRVMKSALGRVGAAMQKAAREYIRDQKGDWEPLKDETVARKESQGKSNKTLVADAEMIREITSEAEADQVTCGVKAASIRAGAARAHEFGYEPGGIPKRPFLRPAIEAAVEAGEIIEPFRDSILRSLKGGG